MVTVNTAPHPPPRDAVGLVVPEKLGFGRKRTKIAAMSHALVGSMSAVSISGSCRLHSSRGTPNFGFSNTLRGQALHIKGTIFFLLK